MKFWLVKSEPETFSYAQQAALGKKGGGWEGVRNHQAKNNMMAMSVGDQVLFYHSGDEKAVVGLIEVIEPYQPDPTDETGKFGMVKVRAIQALQKPVTLAMIKSDPAFEGLALIRHTRLSVMPVEPAHFERIKNLGGI